MNKLSLNDLSNSLRDRFVKDMTDVKDVKEIISIKNLQLMQETLTVVY